MSVRGSNAKLPTRTYSIALYSRTSNIRILQARKNKKRAPVRIWNLKFPVSGEFPHQKSVLFSIQCKSIKTTLRYGFGSVRSGYGLEYSADIPKLSVGFFRSPVIFQFYRLARTTGIRNIDASGITFPKNKSAITRSSFTKRNLPESDINKKFPKIPWQKKWKRFFFFFELGWV